MKNSSGNLFRRAFVVMVGVLSVYPFSTATAADAMDWPHWRGPEMNGISREKGIVDKWNPKGENVLWKNDDVGGRSTPIVMNGKLYTICRNQRESKFEGEKVVCLDIKNGKVLWENKFNVFLSDVPDTRVGWSCVTGDPETGNVFALGVCGLFQCINGETGATIWKHSLSEEYGLLSTYGGRTNVPLIHGQVVTISAVVIGWGAMAKPSHRFIAFDKRNGQAVWFEGTRPLPYDTTYSSPVLTVINGQSLMVFGSGDGGIHAFQPQTGRKIWTFNVSRRGINTTPLVVGNSIFAGHSEENIGSTKMGALFAIDGAKTGDITKTGEKWRIPEWYVGKSSPVHVDGKIFAAEDKGTLLIVNAKDGKLLKSMKLRGPVRASPLFVDGKVFVCTSNGIWWTLKPTPTGADVLFRGRFSGTEVYGSPIVSHGRLFVPSTQALYCIGSKDAKPAVDKRPAVAKEKPREEDAVVAHAQVVPVESLLRPSVEGGQGQEFQVRLFNSRGQFLRLAKPDEVTFSINGPGKIAKGNIDVKGKSHVGWEYTTPKQPVHKAVYVTAKVAKLEGKARIRLVPDYDWNFNFDDGLVPVTWVGCRYRHIAVDYKLLTKLEKENALAAQAYLYLMTSFTNTNNPKITGGLAAQVYNDATPRRTWSALLRFLKLLETVKTLDQAKAKLDPVLAILAREKIVAKHAWTNLKAGVQLAVTRGPRKIDGNGVMVKIKTIPKGARSQGWMGHIGGSNYTIQADVLGARKDNKMPDIGLSAQRYTLDMQGANQRLQIRTWPTQERMAKSTPFKWDPNKWYTMKLQAQLQTNGGKTTAVLKGKVWIKGQKEPAKWQVEATDESPNLNGSPGVFGNAIDAEVFYDNLTVKKNNKKK